MKGSAKNDVVTAELRKKSQALTRNLPAAAKAGDMFKDRAERMKYLQTSVLKTIERERRFKNRMQTRIKPAGLHQENLFHHIKKGDPFPVFKKGKLDIDKIDHTEIGQRSL